MPFENIELEQHLLKLLDQRDGDSSICPSDVARSLQPDDEAGWRALMPRIREVAIALARLDRIEITRGSTVLKLDAIDGGPIRLRRGPVFRV